MAISIFQANDALKMLHEDGSVTAITLPTGVILRTNTPPRWEVVDQFVVLVNTPSQPLIIDAAGVARLLCPQAPGVAPILSSTGSTGTLSGTYAGVRYTFLTRDTEGRLISESDYSPASNSVTISSKQLKATNVGVSADQITGRRLYRPITTGSTLYPWIEIDGNTITVIEDDLSDASLALVAAPALGTPPVNLTHIATFRGRLFGVSSDDRDAARFSEADVRYAWPEDNALAIQPVGSDTLGVTAFLKRRDALGVGKSNHLIQITGTGQDDEENGTVDFDTVTLSNELGVESQESVCVFRDTAYFLWKDGVYAWGPEGIVCISDSNVRSWFTTDDYFNRNFFQHAFAVVDPIRFKYRLFLASADAEVANRWVEYDILTKKWWGPHKTDLFDPTSAFLLLNSQNVRIPIIGGSDGYLYQEQATRTDGSGTGAVAITMDVIGKRHDAGEPDLEKYWGQLSVEGEPQSTGSYVSVLSTPGELDASRTGTQYYHQTLARQKLGRLGTGKHLQLRWQHSTTGAPVALYGYEIDDVNLIGRR